MLQKILIEITKDKKGIEIGGPSKTGLLIYQHSLLMDNVVFSNNTIWYKQNTEYIYY